MNAQRPVSRLGYPEDLIVGACRLVDAQRDEQHGDDPAVLTDHVRSMESGR